MKHIFNAWWRNADWRRRVAPHVYGVAFLLVLCFFLFFHRLAERSLSSSHEARAAQNAQMMRMDGCWSLPRLFNQRLELQKPPLYYWLVAAVSWLRGVDVDAAAVRLPAALSALGCVLVVYLLLAASGRPRAGFLAALILATCVHFTWLARVGRIDMPLTLAVTVALAFWHLARGIRRADLEGANSWRNDAGKYPEGVQQNSPGQRPGNGEQRKIPALKGRNNKTKGILCCALIAYIAIAIGILLKGPLALVLVFLGVITQMSAAYFARFAGRSWPLASSPSPRSTEERGEAQSPSPILGSLVWGVPLVVLLAAPWFVYANWQTDGKLWQEFFVHHNLQRGLGGADDLDGEPIWYYFPRLCIDLLPWSLVAPIVIFLVFRRGFRGDADARFGLLWFVAIVGFFSLMHFKRADYLLPAYPGFAICLGCLIDVLGGTPFGTPKGVAARIDVTPFGVPKGVPPSRISPCVLMVLVVAMMCTMGWAIYLADIAKDDPRTYRRFAQEIRRRTDRPVIFFRTEAHEVVFHVGRPLDTILEWENLDFWAARPKTTYFVMPPDAAEAWPRHLQKGQLEEVLRSTDFGTGERPLVLLRSKRHTTDQPSFPYHSP